MLEMHLKKNFSGRDAHLSTLPNGAVRNTVDSLGSEIVSGEMPVGQTIPLESELAERFEVSRTVIREAIKVLSGKGLIKTARRYGTRVRPHSDWNLLDPDVIRWHSPESPMAARIYMDASALRYIIEPEAAALAAAGASAEQSIRIMDAARDLHSDATGFDEMFAADYDFHATILEASGNVMLSNFRGLIRAILEFSYSTGREGLQAENLTREQHIAVADAITRKDSEEARRLTRKMLGQNLSIGNRLISESSEDD